MFGIFPDKGGNSLQAYLLPTYPDNDLSDRTLSLLYNSCLWDIHHNRFIYYRLFYKTIINKKWFKLVYPHACGLNEHWSGLSLCVWSWWKLKWVILVHGWNSCASSIEQVSYWYVGLTGVESTSLRETRFMARRHEILQRVYNLNLRVDLTTLGALDKNFKWGLSYI